jgi:hypothetical protein
MGKYSQFDPGENVIFTDATNAAHASRATIDEIFDELIAIARARPEPVYVVACWKNAGFADRAVAEYYGQRTAELLKHVRGVVRYGADDPITRSFIRTESMKHRDEGVRSNLFETRADALAAVRAMTAGRATARR